MKVPRTIQENNQPQTNNLRYSPVVIHSDVSTTPRYPTDLPLHSSTTPPLLYTTTKPPLLPASPPSAEERSFDSSYSPSYSVTTVSPSPHAETSYSYTTEDGLGHVSVQIGAVSYPFANHVGINHKDGKHLIADNPDNSHLYKPHAKPPYQTELETE